MLTITANNLWVGRTKNISKEEILLDIYSPEYPELQFVDLPGFTKTPTSGQNPEICADIEELNLPIMKNPNTIILAIHSATEDIGMSVALEYALREDVDKEGNRTIGVLTKLDKVTANSDKMRISKVLNNETKYLKYGYFGVINRSQDDIDNKDIEMSKTRETEQRVFADDCASLF